MPGSQILDNVITAHDLLHFFKNKRKRIAGYMILKLDISKAYDRVKLKYIEAIMLNMGFCFKWSNWILSHISSVTCAFLLMVKKWGTSNLKEVLNKVTSCLHIFS